MTFQDVAATCARTTCASVAIVALAIAAFVVLPESLLYNDYVSGAIFGTTILLVSGVVQVTHDDADGGNPSTTDR